MNLDNPLHVGVEANRLLVRLQLEPLSVLIGDAYADI